MPDMHNISELPIKEKAPRTPVGQTLFQVRIDEAIFRRFRAAAALKGKSAAASVRELIDEFLLKQEKRSSRRAS